MRASITIGKEVKRLGADMAPLHTSIRPVTVKAGRRQETVDGYFRTCNGGATFGLGECTPEVGDFVTAALAKKTARQLAGMLSS